MEHATALLRRPVLQVQDSHSSSAGTQDGQSTGAERLQQLSRGRLQTGCSNSQSGSAAWAQLCRAAGSLRSCVSSLRSLPGLHAPQQALAEVSGLSQLADDAAAGTHPELHDCSLVPQHSDRQVGHCEVKLTSVLQAANPVLQLCVPVRQDQRHQRVIAKEPQLATAGAAWPT